MMSERNLKCKTWLHLIIVALADEINKKLEFVIAKNKYSLYDFAAKCRLKCYLDVIRNRTNVVSSKGSAHTNTNKLLNG